MNRNKRIVLWPAIVVAILWLVGCHRQVKTATETALNRKADKLAQKYIIIDTHQDVPWRIGKKYEDISKRTPTGDFDYPRARQGRLDAVFMVAYVSPEYEEKGGARAFADEAIDMVEGWARDWPDKFVLARSPEEVKEQFGRDRVSLIIAIENGAPVEGDLANLKHFHDRGVRYITLVHSKSNHICDSSFDEERKWHGLSPFGEKVVREMNRLGMIVDVSHASDEAFYRIMEISKAPVVATHSSCRHFTPGWERNMDDKMIKLLAKKGGVIQINFGSMFVSKKVNRRYSERKKDLAERIKADNLQGSEKEAYIKEYVQANPIGDADISDVVANIDHVVKLVGIDYVGLGSDFDGVGGALPTGLKDVSCYPNLIYELLNKGYTQADIEKICSGNFLRVWSNVQKIGVDLRSASKAD
ncbi:MAG: dipeptidase [Phycisphaerae bacterium]|nr:dipeptidase [Phycisphaerae bacterium]